MGTLTGLNQVVIGSFQGKPNTKKITRIYNTAFNQISKLWLLLPESTKMGFESEEADADTMEVEASPPSGSKIGSLEVQVNSLKVLGKQASYKEKMAKKKLKNQLKKKKKSEVKLLLKEEKRKAKKELKEKRFAERLRNGELVEDVSEITEDFENLNAYEGKLNQCVSSEVINGDSPKKMNKKNEVQMINGGGHNGSSGISKKKLKILEAKELKAQRKKEKKKLLKIKKREENLIKTEVIKVENISDTPVKKSSDEVVFNKIDFEDETSKKRFKKEKPKTEKDPVKALSKLEGLNKKISELKVSGQEEKAAVIQSKETWKKAILKADGVKVKDDVKLLKKTIRRKENKKQKSKVEWEQRKGIQQKKMSDSQIKRKENIQKKKNEKKQKKIKKSIKKGRVVI